MVALREASRRIAGAARRAKGGWQMGTAQSSELAVEGRAGTSLPLIVMLFACSGALSLVYEILWLRSLILVFGATTYAVSAVLTAFMGGLALGSYLFGRRADSVALPGVV